MDVGTLADWVGALSGVIAVSAAYGSWKASEKVVKLEHKRDSEREMAAERYQAERLAVVGVECEEGSDSKSYGLLIVNGADAPVFDVHIESQLANGKGTNLPLDLVIVPPGRFIIFIKSGKWDVLLDQDTVRSKTSVIAKGAGGKMVTCVTFSDSSSKRWTLREGRTLVEE